MEKGFVIFITNSGEAIDPTWNRLSSELEAYLFGEMVTVLGNQVVGVTMVFS